MSKRQPPVSVRRTPDFDEDLAVLLKDGGTASDAVRHAVHLIAQAHRYLAQHEAKTGGERLASLSVHTSALRLPRPPSDGSDQGV